MYRHNSSGRKPSLKDKPQNSFSGSRRLTTAGDTCKKVSFFSSPQPEQMDELQIRQARQSVQVSQLEDALHKSRQQLQYIRRAIRQRKIVAELNGQIQILQKSNSQLQAAYEQQAMQTEKYKRTLASTVKQLELAKEGAIESSHLIGKLRFVLSYVLEKMQNLFQTFQSDAVKLEGQLGAQLIDKRMGGYWSSLRKMMAKQQYNIIAYTKRSTQGLFEQGSSGSTITSKLLVKELI